MMLHPRTPFLQALQSHGVAGDQGKMEQEVSPPDVLRTLLGTGLEFPEAVRQLLPYVDRMVLLETILDQPDASDFDRVLGSAVILEEMSGLDRAAVLSLFEKHGIHPLSIAVAIADPKLREKFGQFMDLEEHALELFTVGTGVNETIDPWVVSFHGQHVPDGFVCPYPLLSDPKCAADRADHLNLRSIGKNVRINGRLCMPFKENLETIGEGLQVEGYCDLTGCSGLRKLPDQFKVNGALYLRGCANLDWDPEEPRNAGKAKAVVRDEPK